MQRRTLIQWAASSSALATVSALPSLARAAEAPKDIRLDYAYYNPSSLVIRRFGWLEEEFKKDGIGITWVLSAGSNRALEYLNGNSIDIGSSAGLAAVLAKANGNPIRTPYIFSRPEWTALLVPKNSPIKTIADLKGKKVGSPEWAHSAAVYMRGWMHNDMGVKLTDVHWVQAGANSAGREEKVELNLPKGVKLTRIKDKSLSQLLAAGEIDCAIIARPPTCFLENHPDVVRLFTDYLEMEEKYWEKTKVWPIMHIISMQKKVLDENPWVARNLLNAFNESKRRSVERLMDPAVSRYPVAWLPTYMRKMSDLFGGDTFPYGIEENRPTWEQMLRYTYEQGIAKRHAKPEEIFPKGIMTSVRV